MRNPIRSETDAFYLTLGVACLLVAAAVLGAFADPLVGVAVVAAAAVGALIWELSSKDPDRRRPLREAAAEGRRTAPANPQQRVLVVANRTLQGDELTQLLRSRARAGADLRIVAPILVSRARYLASDVDGELADARERLGAALDWARNEGCQASGRVGDPIAAFGAIEDELRVFAADEIVISTFPEGQSNWLETDIVERLREELDIPITHVTSEDDQPSRTAKRLAGATAS